jgi:hypothetical protein
VPVQIQHHLAVEVAVQVVLLVQMVQLMVVLPDHLVVAVVVVAEVMELLVVVVITEPVAQFVLFGLALAD